MCNSSEAPKKNLVLIFVGNSQVSMNFFFLAALDLRTQEKAKKKKKL